MWFFVNGIMLLTCACGILFIQLNTSSTLRSTIVKIWQEEGVRCLTKGLSARLMYSGPASAIIVSSYELMKKICAKSDATVSL